MSAFINIDYINNTTWYIATGIARTETSPYDLLINKYERFENVFCISTFAFCFYLLAENFNLTVTKHCNGKRLYSW